MCVWLLGHRSQKADLFCILVHISDCTHASQTVNRIEVQNSVMLMDEVILEKQTVVVQRQQFFLFVFCQPSIATTLSCKWSLTNYDSVNVAWLQHSGLSKSVKC